MVNAGGRTAGEKSVDWKREERNRCVKRWEDGGQKRGGREEREREREKERGGGENSEWVSQREMEW